MTFAIFQTSEGMWMYSSTAECLPSLEKWGSMVYLQCRNKQGEEERIIKRRRRGGDGDGGERGRRGGGPLPKVPICMVTEELGRRIFFSLLKIEYFLVYPDYSPPTPSSCSPLPFYSRSTYFPPFIRKEQASKI